jgi:CspA family cold shock protein
MNMPTGKVKWFNSKKGYGFITPDAVIAKNKCDVFVHYSVIEAAQTQQFRSLERGQKVDFEYIFGPKGLFATKVLVK